MSGSNFAAWLTAALLAGLANMMASEFAQRLVQHTTTPYPWILAMLAIGSVLTVKAYRGADTTEEYPEPYPFHGGKRSPDDSQWIGVSVAGGRLGLLSFSRS